MIELRTLGLIDLRGTEGAELRPVLRQPKRLALFAYLALATPHRFHRRDTLLAMFWPDLDTMHARAALRRATYFLRQALGEGVVISRGEEELGVDFTALRCDAHVFERALDEQREADGLALYRGELLEGLYVAGSPDFERWLAEQRGHLHERASRAAWALSDRERKRGDAAAAAQWARRGAGLTPLDEEAHRRLVLRLGDAGDVAAAIRAFDEFSRRLRAEFGVDPSERTRQAVADVRASRAATGPLNARTDSADAETASHPGEPPVSTSGDEGVIAVLPFTVRGGAEVAYLREGMVDLLATALDGAGKRRTVEPRALLSFVGTDGGELVPAQAQDVARHFGAGLYLLGGIVEAGGRLRVTAALYRANGEQIARAEVRTESEGRIFEMVDELTRRLLAGQSRGPGERWSQLAALTTESVPALKAYLCGEHDFRHGRFVEALGWFRRAAAEDTSFGLAYSRLAAAAAAVADLELARWAADRAQANRDRLADHDRLLLDAQHAWLRGAADEAERLYADAVATHPDDLEAWFHLGDVLFHHNPMRGRPIAESRDAFERALHYDPAHVSALTHLARLAAHDGRVADLEDIVRRALELSPTGDRALGLRALRAFALDSQLEKLSLAAGFARASGLAVGIAFSDIVLYARAFKDVHRLGRLLGKLAREPEAKALFHINLALLETAEGRFGDAQGDIQHTAQYDHAWSLEVGSLFLCLPFIAVPAETLDAQRKALESWQPESVAPHRSQVLASHNGLHPLLRHYLLGALAARAGDGAAALDHATALERMIGSAPLTAPQLSLGHCLVRSVRAQTAWRAGKPDEALALLEGSSGEFWYQLALTSPFYSQALERYVRAELLAELGRDEEALRWYASLGETSTYEVIYLAPAHLRRGQILERLGQADAAAEQFARGAELWSDAEDVFSPLPNAAGRPAASARRARSPRSY